MRHNKSQIRYLKKPRTLLFQIEIVDKVVEVVVVEVKVVVAVVVVVVVSIIVTSKFGGAEISSYGNLTLLKFYPRI